MKLNLLLLSTFALILSIFATTQVDIPMLNELEFDKLIERSIGKENTLVMFKTEWCGHCKSATPIIINMAPKLSKKYPKMKMAFVDCDAQKSLCKKHRVRGYPSIRLYEDKKNYLEYDDTLSESSLIYFLNDLSDDNRRSLDDPEKAELKFAKMLTDKDYDATLKTYEASLVYFTADWCQHCQRQLIQWELAAEQLKGNKAKNVFVVDCEAGGKATCNKLNIEGYPMMLYYSNGKKMSEYQDEAKQENILNFLANPKVSQDNETPHKDEKTDSNKDESSDLLSNKFKNVQILNKDAYKKNVLSPVDKNQDVMVMFMAPWCGACQEAAPEYDRIAGVMKTKKVELAKSGRSVLLAAVNCDDSTTSDFCNEQKVEGYPTFIHFRGGKRISEYEKLPISDEMVTYFMNAKKMKDEL